MATQSIAQFYEANLKEDPAFCEDIPLIVALVGVSARYASHTEFPEAYEDFFRECNAILPAKNNFEKNSSACNRFITAVAASRTAALKNQLS